MFCMLYSFFCVIPRLPNFSVLTFRNTLSVPSPQVVSTNLCSGTSTHKIQTPIESPRRKNTSIVKFFLTNCLKLTQPQAVLSTFQLQLSIIFIPYHDVTQPPVSITSSLLSAPPLAALFTAALHCPQNITLYPLVLSLQVHSVTVP